MKVDDLMDAMGKIDARYVTEAEEPYQKKKRKFFANQWIKVGLPITACLVFFVAGGVVLRQTTIYESENETASLPESAEAVEDIAEDVNLAEDMNVAEKAAGNAEDAAEKADEAESVPEGKMAEEVTDAAGTTFYKNEWTQTALEEECADASDAALALQEASNEVEALSGGSEDSHDIAGVFSDSLTKMGFVRQESTSYDGAEKLCFEREKDGAVFLVTYGEAVLSRFGSLFEQKDLRVSTCNGRPVIFVQLDGKAHYLAQYQSGTIFVEIEGEEMTEEEFLEVLEEVIY